MSSAPFEKNMAPNFHSLTPPSLFPLLKKKILGKKEDKQLYNLYMFDFFMYMYIRFIHVNAPPPLLLSLIHI